MALGHNSISRVGLSNNQLIDALLNDGWRFKDGSNGPVLSSSFALAAIHPALNDAIAARPEIIDYVLDWSWGIPHDPQREVNQIISIGNAFQAWENVANIDLRMGPRWNFTNYSDNAEIVLHRVHSSSIGGFGGYSGTAGQATQVTHDTWNDGTEHSVHVADHGRVHTYLAADGFLRGNGDDPELTFDPVTGDASPGGMMLIMHEIGHALGLKHPHDSGAITNNTFLPAGQDHMINTIMSYNPARTALAGAIESTAAATTPMALDIAAIQHLYGVNRNFNKGNSTYTLTDASWSCIWDAGGTDQIVYNGAVDAVINLNPATLDNTTTGGGVPSYLISTTTGAPVGATNWATGGFMIAGDVRNALADVNGVTGVIIENSRGGSGNDAITGNGANNKLYGNNGADTLKGLGGNDWLEGGNGDDLLDGGLGADTMRGGAGGDVYIVDNAGDVVTESPSAGTDEVRSSVSFTLGNNVEYLVLTGGNAWTVMQAAPLAAELLAAVNTDVGLTLWHGIIASSAISSNIHSAIYSDIHSNIGGTVAEFATEVSLEWDYVPNINGTGNSLSNIIIGNAGNNIIDGRAGADRMAGGTGDDTYHVDSLGDVVREAAFAGTDTVIATVTHALAANVENLTLAGSAHINGTGNALDNVIVGNDRNNVLDGGTGKDEIFGGLGNDTFVFKSAAETGVGFTADVIQDFEDFRDDDTIDLSGFAGTLTFSTAAAFSGLLNEVIAVQAGNDVLIRINTGGTIAAEAEIVLGNTLLSQINGSDFLL